MQPTPPDPSSEQPSQDAPAASEPSSESVEQPTRGSWFLQRLWRGRNGRFTSEGESDQDQETTEPQTSSTITLTQEELDRKIQAETDRREAKRANDAKAAERRRLRDEDPWAYAEAERQAERTVQQDTQATAVLGQIGSVHDRYSIDPIVEQLPEAERQRIMSLEGAGVGLDGRKLIVTESLKALEKHWKAEGARDAEERLRRNPAFRKQVFSQFRRGAPEPEFITGGAPSEGDRSVSSILRQQLGGHRSL